MGMRVGILGGGQLARMMALEAHRLGIEPHIFSSSAQDPAAQVSKFWTHGNLQDFKALDVFIESMDYVTFESEFAPTASLERWQNSWEKKTPEKIFPRPSVMKRLQNRASQKQTLIDFKIPTSPYLEISKSSELETVIQQLGPRFVLKTTFGGYDGYGTFFAKTPADIAKLSDQMNNSTQSFIAEKFVSFQREIAVILVRTHSGKCFSLPLVETKQTDGRCDWVIGPISHKAYAGLEKKLFRMLNELEYVGVMGVEMFDTGKEILVNELAPRVHNSGHYSQEALSQSQFSLHLRAGLDHNLEIPKLIGKEFVMVNLLGESDKKLQVPEKLSGTLHLYGKSDNRPGRKMGHVNYVSLKKIPGLLKFALKERKGFQL